MVLPQLHKVIWGGRGLKQNQIRVVGALNIYIEKTYAKKGD